MKLGDRRIFEKWIVTTAIGFVVRQLEKFGKDTDWAKVKADLGVRVEQLMPGTWFDDEARAISDAIIDACARGLGNAKTLGIILELVADGKYQEAGAKLREYLLKTWRPDATDLLAHKAMALLEAAA